MKPTGSDIAARTRGRIVSGGPSLVPSGMSIDSRTVQAGELFFAIVGPSHDGHRFAAAALSAGASGVVVSDAAAAADLPESALVILVEDTTRALQDLAAARRRDGKLVVAAITGSVGKTTTKEMTRTLVAGERRVHASPGNLNNHHGLPLAILAMPESTEVAVLEMGISTPGEMDRLVEIAAPDFGLVTLVSSVHVGNFASFADLCDEKMKLPRGSRLALLNADDPEQVSRASGVRAPTKWFGEAEGASDLRLVELRKEGLLGSTLVVEEDGAKRTLRCPLPGAHNARNLVAAGCLARAIGISWEAIERQAPSILPSRHRGEILDVGGATIVDDTYNANPRAMRAALELLAEVPAAGRRIFVAGDMLELGDIAEREHESLGRLAAGRVDLLLGVGRESLAVVEAAQAAGLSAEHVPDARSAGAWLERTLRAGDVVLVKGSRGMRLEEAIASVVASRRATRDEGSVAP